MTGTIKKLYHTLTDTSEIAEAITPGYETAIFTKPDEIAEKYIKDADQRDDLSIDLTALVCDAHRLGFEMGLKARELLAASVNSEGKEG